MPMDSPRGNPQNLPFIRKRVIQLNPVNSNGSSYSFKGGLPLIKFDIASSDIPLFLEGKELRLSGNLTFRKGNAGALAITETNFVDGFTGSIASVIDTITVSSKRLNSVLERVNLYSRMVPSVISGVHSQEDIQTSLCHGGLHTETIPLQRPVITALDAFNTQGDVAAASRRGKTFSTPLYCGIFQSGEDLDLSAGTGVGGLTIEILLKSDVNCAFGTDASANNVSFTLDNLLLTVPVYEYANPNYREQINMYNFNSWSSIFQTINSSDSVISFTPGLKRCASVFMNFITSSDLGNQLYNYSRLGPVGQLRQIRYSKNGSLFPLQFRLETVEERNDDALTTAGNNELSEHTVKARAMPLRNYLESVKTDAYSKVQHTCSQWNSWGSAALDRNQNAGRDGITPTTADGLGILYDKYGSGTDFSQTVFSTELQFSGTSEALPQVGGANQKNSLDGTSATSQAVCLYFLNKNTIQMSSQGINVIR